MLHDLKKNLPHGSLVTMSDTGAQINIYFRFGCSILMHTVKFQLLILNGHGSHVKATDALKYAEKHNITIICLPPPHHSSHTASGCIVFKPLKSHYVQSCSRFTRLNPGKVITRNKFQQLFTEAYVTTASMEIAVNSFRCMGIYLYDDKIFPDSVCIPCASTDRPFQSGEQVMPSTHFLFQKVIVNPAHVTASLLSDIIIFYCIIGNCQVVFYVLAI